MALVPKQVLAESEMGAAVADAYAKMGGITPEKFMERFGTPLTPVDRREGDRRTSRRGELGREGTVLGISGTGIEPL